MLGAFQRSPGFHRFPHARQVMMIDRRPGTPASQPNGPRKKPVTKDRVTLTPRWFAVT